MSGSIEVIDLTQPLSEATPMIQLPPPFANTPNWKTHEISRYDEKGPAWYWNWFEGGEHAGTHFDAPIHWVTGKDKDDVSQVPVKRLIGPAIVGALIKAVGIRQAMAFPLVLSLVLVALSRVLSRTEPWEDGGRPASLAIPESPRILR